MWANAQRGGRPAEHRRRLCSTPQSVADAHYLTAVQKRCQDAKAVENSWDAQTTGPISADGRPKFTILCGHLEKILLLNKFFSDCRYVP